MRRISNPTSDIQHPWASTLQATVDMVTATWRATHSNGAKTCTTAMTQASCVSFGVAVGTATPSSVALPSASGGNRRSTLVTSVSVLPQVSEQGAQDCAVEGPRAVVGGATRDEERKQTTALFVSSEQCAGAAQKGLPSASCCSVPDSGLS